MDNIFKETVEIYAFSACYTFSRSWRLQVILLPEYWDNLLDGFNLKELEDSFHRHCSKLNFNSEFYNITEAFAKCKDKNSDWCKDLQHRVAKEILEHYDAKNSPLYEDMFYNGKWYDIHRTC